MPRHLLRHVAVLLVALAFAACGGGGGSDAVTPTGSTQPGPPASLTMVTGDGQTAPLRTQLPVRLSVLVKDATGRPVPNVAVQFSVDSGGGSLTSAAATTGSDGVALSGDWTLGDLVGPQVVSARAAALTPVRFRAQALGPTTQTLFTQTPVAPNGGTLVFRKSGDKLDGLTITVPAGAYPVSTQWTVIADSVNPAKLPTGFAQVGPMLVIGNGQGYADSIMTLTLPLPSAYGVTDVDAMAPFYYDDVSGTFEGIPLTSRTATTATLATRHFSRDALALPVNSSVAASLRTAGTVAFGDVKIVWVKAPRSSLTGAFDSGFRPGVDNWEFVNQGEYAMPLGSCEGMSLTAMYYYYFQRKGGAPPLYRRFDLTLENVLDNVQGIRFAGSVQKDYEDRYAKIPFAYATLAEQAIAKGTNIDDLTSTWILLTLKLTKNPVLLALHRQGGGHAVVAYAATSTGAHVEVAFADPNFPTAKRTMVFESGRPTPVSASPKAGANAEQYDKIYALAATAEVPLVQLASRYAEFTRQQAGADRYPANYRVEVFNNLSDAWEPLPRTLATTDQDLDVRFICTSCPTRSPNPLTTEHKIEIWDAAGATRLSPDGFGINKVGTVSYYAKMSAYTVSEPTQTGFVDAVPFTVAYRKFAISPIATSTTPRGRVSFTADPGELATTGATYTWQADDGTPVVVTSAPSVTHQFDRPGDNKMSVTLKDATGRPIAKTTASITVLYAVTFLPSPLVAAPGKPVDITAVVEGGLPPALVGNVDYVWEIDSPTFDAPVDITTSTPTLTYTFAKEGTYTLQVLVGTKDTPGKPGSVIGSSTANATVTVREEFAVWRITSVTTRIGPTPLTEGEQFVLRDLVNSYTGDSTFWTEIKTGARDGVLVFATKAVAGNGGRGLYMFPRTPVDFAAIPAMPTGLIGVVTSDVNLQGTPTPTYSESGSPPGNATISGLGWGSSVPSTPRQANYYTEARVTFSGNTATGQLTKTYIWYGGSDWHLIKQWTSTYTFIATRIR